MDKRGASHVEFIVSFVLFVGFIVAGMYFLSPIDTKGFVESSLHYTFDEIAGNVSTVIESYSFIINSSVQAQVVAIGILPENALMTRSRSEDGSGKVLQSYYNGFTLNVDRENSRFFRTRFSQDIEPEPAIIGTIIGEENYTISSRELKKAIAEKKYKKLVDFYSSDYNGMKEYFDIPESMDFSFSLMLDGEEIKVERDIPGGLEVFSKSERFEVIREDGDIIFGELRVTAW